MPEVLPPQARAWLCLVERDGTVRQWAAGGVDGWRERFSLGSLAKFVVALVVHALESQGQVTLDQPLRPDSPVTLRCLLRHTAGLPDVLPSSTLDLAQTLGTRLFPPGMIFSYSNLGFIAVGDWLVRQTGQPLSALAAQYVFTPYAMAQASLSDAPLGAAGGLTATGEDVARLMGGLLRAPALLNALVTAAVPVLSRPGMSAGLGCFRRVCGDTWLVEHEGFTGETASVVCLAPDAGWGYALLARNWPQRLSRMRPRLEAAWFGFSPPAEVMWRRVPPAAYGRYTGDYVNGIRRLRITCEADRLYLEREGQRFPLVQAGDEDLAVAVPLRDKPSTLAVVTGVDGGVMGLYPFGSLRCLGRSLS